MALSIIDLARVKVGRSNPLPFAGGDVAIAALKDNLKLIIGRFT